MLAAWPLGEVAKFDRDRTNSGLANILSNRLGLAPIGRFRSRFARICTTSASNGGCWNLGLANGHQFGPEWAKCGQAWPKLGQAMAQIGPGCPNLGRSSVSGEIGAQPSDKCWTAFRQPRKSLGSRWATFLNAWRAHPPRHPLAQGLIRDVARAVGDRLASFDGQELCIVARAFATRHPRLRPPQLRARHRSRKHSGTCSGRGWRDSVWSALGSCARW